MILVGLAGFIFGIAKFLIGLFPEVSILLPADFVTTLSSMFVFVAYFLPMDYILFLLSASIAIDVARFNWRLILRVKSFVPAWGN